MLTTKMTYGLPLLLNELFVNRIDRLSGTLSTVFFIFIFDFIIIINRKILLILIIWLLVLVDQFIFYQ